MLLNVNYALICNGDESFVPVNLMYFRRQKTLVMHRFFRSFGFAFNGLRHAVKTQLNFRLHLLSAVAVVALGVYTGLSSLEWVCISLCIGLVMVLELLNTALEIMVDLVSPDYHPKAGLIKDIAAAAVLMAAIVALVVALFIFVPKFCS
jgi:diacylglycerol kinase